MSRTAFYENQQNQQTQTIESPAVKTIDFPKVAKPPFTLAESFANSPRRSHLAKAGGDTLPNGTSDSTTGFCTDKTAYQAPASPSPSADTDYNAQPLPLLLQTLGPYLANMTSTLSLPSLSDESYDFLSDLAPFFTRIEVSSNTVLWRQSDSPDGLYLIEHGSLRATYSYDNHTREVQETMVAGTIAGDLSTLSNTARNATTVAERDCVLWRMDIEALERLEKEHPATARRFTRIVLKGISSLHLRAELIGSCRRGTRCPQLALDCSTVIDVCLLLYLCRPPWTTLPSVFLFSYPYYTINIDSSTRCISIKLYTNAGMNLFVNVYMQSTFCQV
jgi:SulP family sulfate permease